jgi:hypothetical protein
MGTRNEEPVIKWKAVTKVYTTDTKTADSMEPVFINEENKCTTFTTTCNNTKKCLKFI